MQVRAEEMETPLESSAVVSTPVHETGIYTMSEAAVLSKCSYSTIRRAIESGHLAISYIGNQPRVMGAKLLAWIEAGGLTGRSKATM
jgi:excisionase family DNA binding protein